MMLEHAEIRSILPHGHPMVLVDRMLSVEPGVTAIGSKAITGTEDCYGRIATGAPLEEYRYPVSLLLESFGQTAAILWLKSCGPRMGEESVLVFAGASDCVIKSSAYPGDVLLHLPRLEKATGDAVIVSGEIRVGDRLIATIGSMTAAVRSRSWVLAAGSGSAKVTQGGEPECPKE